MSKKSTLDGTYLPQPIRYFLLTKLMTSKFVGYPSVGRVSLNWYIDFFVVLVVAGPEKVHVCIILIKGVFFFVCSSTCHHIGVKVMLSKYSELDN